MFNRSAGAASPWRHALLLLASTMLATSLGAAAESPLGACGENSTRIHEIQGSARSSPLAGELGVVVEAVVVGLFPGFPEGLGGFFVQEEDLDTDRDPLTSEGLFVFAPELETVRELQLGDVVRLRGSVQEFFGKTELSSLDGLLRCAVGGMATSVELRLPVPVVDAAEPSYWERWEGMGVRFVEPLWVVDQYGAGRYGEVGLAAERRLWQATQHVAPGPEAVAWALDDARFRILLDDGQSQFEPDPWPYLEVNPSGTLRLGDRVSELEGTLDYSFGRFRVQPTRAPRFDAVWAAPPPPVVRGALRIVGWNVENLFNGDGTGGRFPTRGAASPLEYERQLAKVVATLIALDGDIIALVELENDGAGENSVLQDLAAALRASGVDYLPVDPTTSLGEHAIAVGMLYRHGAIQPLGPASVLDERAHASFDSRRNRPSLAQTYLHLGTGEVVSVIVNHFKSKGSSCAATGDPDLGDGQGNCNLARRDAARALAEWIESDPILGGNATTLILGDLNAYPLEDPLAELIDAGFVDLLAVFDSPDAYTFVFDGRAGRLDHALTKARALVHVGGAAVWNVHADESSALDYREDNPVGLYRADPRRASDHDPVIVGLFPQLIPEPDTSALAAAAVCVLYGLRHMRGGARPRAETSRS